MSYREAMVDKGAWTRWMCDHCAECFDGNAVSPKHTRQCIPGVHDPIASTRDNSPTYAQSRPVHYCSDECAEWHDALEVEIALKRDGVDCQTCGATFKPNRWAPGNTCEPCIDKAGGWGPT